MVRHWCVVSQDDATVNMCSVLHCGCCGVFFLKLGGMANVLGIEHTSNWCAHENSPQSSGPGFRSSCISIAVSWLCFADFVLFSSFFSSVLKFYSTQGSRAITQPSTSWAQSSLTSLIGREGVCSGLYGRSMLSHVLCSYRNHQKPDLPFNQELELLAMPRSQSQTAVYSNAAPGPVIHSSTWSAAREWFPASALCPEQNNSLDCGVYKMWHL